MPIVIVAELSPRPELFDEFVELLAAALPAVHAEPGCELYALHTGDDRVVMVEQWRDKASLEAHQNGAPMKAVAATMKGRLAERPRMTLLTPVPTGVTGRGVLRD